MARSNPTLRKPDLADVIELFMDDRLGALHVALPGKITKISTDDVKQQKANILPLIKRKVQFRNGKEQVEDLPEIPSVPIVFPRAGDFFISMPLKVGDHVLLIFNERSIELFTSSTGAKPVDPIEVRMHHLADAVAIPGFYPFGRSLVSPDQKSVIIGHDKGCQVHVNEKEVALGSAEPEDAVALASLVKSYLDEIKEAFNGHTHLVKALPDESAGPPTLPTLGPRTDDAVPVDAEIEGNNVASKKVRSD